MHFKQFAKIYTRENKYVYGTSDHYVDITSKYFVDFTSEYYVSIQNIMFLLQNIVLILFQNNNIFIILILHNIFTVFSEVVTQANHLGGESLHLDKVYSVLR